MLQRALGFVLVAALFSGHALAKEDAKHGEHAGHGGHGNHGEHAGHGDEIAQVKGILQNIARDNAAYVKSHKADYFKVFTEGQKPRATVVTCSDSRVHTHALDKTPDNDLFMVRDIGNQLATAEGSIEYGVRHLHTPVLIFIGHSACGAIKAAGGDYSALEPAIKKELDTISIKKGGEVMANVQANVNNQVDAAIKKFDDMFKGGHLAVIGAVYDFRNELKQGYGKLVITNVNGETDPAKVKANPLLATK